MKKIRKRFFIQGVHSGAMANPFNNAFSFLKAETLGRDAMMQEMSNNMTKPDKFGNTRQMTVSGNRDPSAALAGKLVHAQERMRTGPINDPNDNISFGEEGGGDYEDMQSTEEREPFNGQMGEDDTEQLQTIRSGNTDRGERAKLREMASQLGMQHKDIPYPVPPEMFEQMATEYQMMNQDTYD